MLFQYVCQTASLFSPYECTLTHAQTRVHTRCLHVIRVKTFLHIQIPFFISLCHTLDGLGALTLEFQTTRDNDSTICVLWSSSTDIQKYIENCFLGFMQIG